MLQCHQCQLTMINYPVRSKTTSAEQLEQILIQRKTDQKRTEDRNKKGTRERKNGRIERMEEKGKGIKKEGNTEARRRVPGGWRPVDGGSCMMDWKSRGQELRRLFSASWLIY